MTTYREIAASETDTDSPVTETLMVAFAGNPKAIAEASTGAYINQHLWHPHNSTLVGDANDGVFWDHSLDGDTASLESPTLVDGYDYGLRLVGVSPSGGTPIVTIQVYLATTAAWTTIKSTSAQSAALTASGFFAVFAPRVAANGWGGRWIHAYTGNGGVVLDDAIGSAGHATSQKISGLRVYAGGTTFDAGTVALYRRRNVFGEY